MASVTALRTLVGALLAGCFGAGGSVPEFPSTPGTYSMIFEQGSTGKGPKTSYGGPASFNLAGGHTQIILWTDSTFTTSLVTLVRDQALTGPGSFTVSDPASVANNPSTAATVFVVTDAFENPPATELGGEVVVIDLSSDELKGQIGYADEAHSVDAAV